MSDDVNLHSSDIVAIYINVYWDEFENIFKRQREITLANVGGGAKILKNINEGLQIFCQIL